MKKFVFGLFAALLVTAQNAICFAEEVSPEIEKSLKGTTSEPNVLTIVTSLLVVILLIYITGIIYSKLNLVGAKAVREQVKSHDLSRAIILSTTQLGQGKNLHVIELNKKKYLIGAAQNSITMLKELDDIQPQKTETKAETIVNKETSEIKEEDDTYKKYL